MHLLLIDESTARIFLVRHGEVENHDQTIFNGQLTMDITAQGVATWSGRVIKRAILGTPYFISAYAPFSVLASAIAGYERRWGQVLNHRFAALPG